MQTAIRFSIPIHLNGRCGSCKYTNGSSDILMLVSGERCFFLGSESCSYHIYQQRLTESVVEAAAIFFFLLYVTPAK